VERSADNPNSTANPTPDYWADAEFRIWETAEGAAPAVSRGSDTPRGALAEARAQVAAVMADDESYHTAPRDRHEAERAAALAARWAGWDHRDYYPDWPDLAGA